MPKNITTDFFGRWKLFTANNIPHQMMQRDHRRGSSSDFTVTNPPWREFPNGISPWFEVGET
jgi:hypothetical protein